MTMAHNANAMMVASMIMLCMATSFRQPFTAAFLI
jgi:hypothetical protein